MTGYLIATDGSAASADSQAVRDLAASLVDGVTELPGMTREIERYFRDLYDHIVAGRLVLFRRRGWL